jgi:uroporphyrin-III C-methyltransferase
MTESAEIHKAASEPINLLSNGRLKREESPPEAFDGERSPESRGCARLLPVFLRIEGRRCLLAGAGKVALGKIGVLLKAGLELRVVAPEALPEIRQLASDGKLEWVRRSFAPADLDGHALAVAATNSPEVNAAVHQGAAERKILLNCVDDAPNCDFFFGSVVSRGALQVAISTGGASPAFAQRLRREIDERLPAELGPWLDNLGQLRREILATQPAGEERRRLLLELAQRPIRASEDCPSRLLDSGSPDAFSSLAPERPDQEQPDPSWLDEEQLDEEQDEEQEAASTSCEEEDSSAFREPLPPEFGEEYIQENFSASPETVHLVGAGPGDPELLTVKALRLIQTADVLLHDDLVPQAILDLASPSAEVLNVGKRCGSKGITQNQINTLMIEHARQGRTVVRLKGGDPLLFGRAAEELDALAAAGIPFQIVPGITAAFAAAAALGCPLTDRNCASSVVLTTGHRAAEHFRQAQPQDLPLVRLGASTLAVYMPGRELRLLAQKWIEQGLPPELPCAVVSRAALPGQQTQCTTLATLGDIEPTAAPSLLIAGWAVRQIFGPGKRASEL